MVRARKRRSARVATALVACFLVQLLLAVWLHLDTAIARRTLARWATDFISVNLRGSVDLGTVEKLTPTCVWLRNVVLYDPQHRRVISIDRVIAHTSALSTFFRWLTRNDQLNVVVESLRADGVQLRLHPDPITEWPSLVQALEPRPDLRPSTASTAKPYRVLLANIEVGRVDIESTLPGFASNSSRLRQVSGQLLFTNDSIAASVKRFSLDVTELTPSPLHAFGNIEIRSPDRVWGDVNAQLAGISASIHVDYRGGSLDATAHSAPISPELATHFIPNWPLKLPITASLTVHGPIQRLGIQSGVVAGNSRLEAVGTVQLGLRPRADLTLEVKTLDIQPLFGVAIDSRLDAAARVILNTEDAGPRMRLEGLVLPGRVGEQATPSIDVIGEYDTSGLLLSGRSRDPDLPLRAAVMLRARELSVDAQINGLALGRVVPKALVGGLGGVADIRARGKLANGVLTSTLDATLRDVALNQARLSRATIVANATGPFDVPSRWAGEARIAAEGLTAPLASLDKIDIQLSGSATKAHVSVVAEQPGSDKFSFDAEAFPTMGLDLHSLRLELARGHAQLSIRAPLLKFDNETWLVQDAMVEGTLGHAEVTLGMRDEQLFGKVEAPSLDLSALSDIIGLPDHSLSGHASLSSHFDTRTKPSTGHARLELKGANLVFLTNVSGSGEAELNANQVLASAQFSSDLIDSIQGKAELSLETPLARIDAVKKARGSASLDLTRIRLDRVGMLLGALRPGLTIGGTANVRADVLRSNAATAPNVTLNVITQEATATFPGANRSIDVAGYDALLSLALAGESGAVTANWLLARQGQPRAQLNATGALPPIEEWLLNPASLLAKWQDLPFEANLTLPRQAIGEFGAILADVTPTGDAGASLWLRGPWSHGHAVLEVQGHDMRSPETPAEASADVQGLAEYLRESGEIRLQLSLAHQQRPYAQLNAEGAILPCLAGFDCIKDWSGRIELGLLGLPIEILPAIGHLGFNGDLRGVISVRRTDSMTAVDGVVPLDNFRVSGHPLGQTLVNLRSDNGQLVVGAKLIDGGAEVDLEGHLPVDWQHLIPRQRQGEPIHLTATAKGYDAGVIGPWLDEYVTDLAGQLDGNLEATYSTVEDGDGKSIPHLAMGGRLGLRHGAAELRSLGQKFSDISFDAQASSTATRTTLTIPRVSAAVGNGEGRVSGSMVIEFDALALKRLAARIDQANSVPVSINSVDLATVSASGNIELQPGSTGYDVDAKFDSLDVKLARVASRQVVGLSEHPEITTIQPLGSDAWKKARSRQGSTYRFRVDLGSKARISRGDFNLPVTGTPSIELSDRMRPSGAVQLEPLGRLQLFGKVFVIDRGRVTFDPDQPSNPRLDVTGSWRGPTHVVTVQIQGTREEARLRWSSDPPLSSESQVLALLLGGGSGDDSTASAGLGVGATLFHEVLSQTALSSLEVRTSADERHANYTAAVPLRENLWFEATYQSPTNTSLPGSSAQRGFSGTVDYRFRRNWSVRTEVGTLGAGADLLWQYRY